MSGPDQGVIGPFFSPAVETVLTKVWVLPLPATSTSSQGGSDFGSTRQGGRSVAALVHDRDRLR
ncbi:MAG: hypothetical protein M0C28_47690 [Candidatus Moduliflexus flocculans]|nr:hypothetical protein [Candidatus Moduliflexus flocculans]